MVVKLIRYNLKDAPEWFVINETVPLGTLYEVMGYHKDATMVNLEQGFIKKIDLYLLRGNGGEGWLPAECFEIIPEIPILLFKEYGITTRGN